MFTSHVASPQILQKVLHGCSENMLGTMALTACQFMEEPGMAVQMRESKHPYNNNTNFEVNRTCITVRWVCRTWGLTENHQGGWNRSLTVFHVCSHGTSVPGAPVKYLSCFWGWCQMTDALPCEEMCSIGHFNVVLVQSCEKCIT